MTTDIPQIYTVKSRTLTDINRLLHLSNRRSNQDNARQIIQALQEKYAYEGDYDTRYIREFIKIYNAKIHNELDGYIRQIKLDYIKNANDNYYIDYDKYNQLINPQHNEEITQQAENILHQNHIEDSIDSDVEELQNENNIGLQNDEQNNFLTNKDMTEEFPRANFGVENLRRQSIANIGGVNRVDLETMLNNMQQHRNVNPNLRPRTKKNKYGIKGMDDLIKVVVNLKNDVKQIREAQSVESAQDWIDSHGYGDLYDVNEEDLDGDGYNEVVVKDKTGKKVIVNGYTTTPSLFPYRRQYYSTHPTKESRKNVPWKKYIKDEFYHPTYDATGRNITGVNEDATRFDENLRTVGYTKSMKPKDATSYQVFTVRCINPFYQALKWLRGSHPVPFKLAQLAGYVWKEIVRDPALTHVYGAQVLETVTDAKEIAKLCKQREVKQAIENIVVPYITNPTGMFEDILPMIVDTWRANGYRMTAHEVRDFILVSRAIVNKMQLPPRDAFNAWKVEILKNQQVKDYVEQVAAYHEE